MNHHSETISDQIVTLLNVVSSDCEGRAYLLPSNSGLIANMIQVLKSTTKDGVLRKNILESLKKLSLRYHIQ